MKKLLGFIIIVLISASLQAQHDYNKKYFPPTDPLVAQKLEQWQDLKFGLLMHWGPYSQWGVVESWSICSEDEGWCKRPEDDYVAYKKKYEGLQNTFNPTSFDPSKWAKAAAGAGMKYVVFTTKHHDGFCMFDTKYTDYKITDPKTPFSKNPKANVTKEIFNAFRAEGLWAGAYFSKPDWHSPYYWWPNFATPDRNVNYDIRKYPERWENFVQYTQNQIMELMSDYGKIDILWLDGGWVEKMTPEQIKSYITAPDYNFMHIQNQDIRMDELAAKARVLQPGLIVVDRAVEGPNQNYLTPENQVPKEMLAYPWESCIIMGGGWSYAFDAKYKSGRELVHMLIDIVAKGGNLLLNIAPSPKGTWDDAAYQRLAEIGKWMNVNSEAIYGTRKVAPYYEGSVYHTQKKDGSAHYVLYCLKEGEKMPAEIKVNGIDPSSKPVIEILGSKGKVSYSGSENGIVIKVPKSMQKENDLPYAIVFRVR
jgi:alpha-L-fucosidase